MQTIKFATFPFEHKGFKFVSRIAETCEHLPMIMLMGDEFIKMNKEAIDELINIDQYTSRLLIELKLKIINDGGTQMFLELAGE